MGFYQIQEGTSKERNRMKMRLSGLDRLSSELQEKVITAWVSAWKSSMYDDVEDMPGFSFSSYKLMDHVDDVVYFGIPLAKGVEKKWRIKIDWEFLIALFLLHDIDKPLLLYIENGEIKKTKAAFEVQHGVLGAMLVKDLGFSDEVVSAVATHATNSPFHSSRREAYILHYADLFAADHALMLEKKLPYYQKLK